MHKQGVEEVRRSAAAAAIYQFVQETLAFLAVSCSFLMIRATSPSGTSGAGAGITSHNGRSPLPEFVEKCPIRFWLVASAVCEARCIWPDITNGEVVGALITVPPTCAVAPVPQNAHTTDRKKSFFILVSSFQSTNGPRRPLVAGEVWPALGGSKSPSKRMANFSAVLAP